MSSNVLSIKPFRRLWIGQAVSQFGDALYLLIFLFMVGKLTGSVAMVGYIGATKALPYLLLGPYAGVLADRMDRKTIMWLTDGISAGVLLILAVVVWFDPTPPIWTIFVAGGLLATVNVFFLPAKSAALPNLVPAEKLLEANSLSAATQNLMPLIGLAMSAVVLGAVYAQFPNYFFLTAILANAASFIYSAVCILQLPSVVPDRSLHEKKKVLEDTIDGIKLIWGDHVLKVTLLLSVFLNLFISPFMVVYIAANNEWFGGQFSTLAWFELAFSGGMVVGSIAVGRLKIDRPGFAFAVGLFIVGLTLVPMALGAYFWNFLIWNIVAGLFLPYATVPINTYFQLAVPDAFRGRVNSALTMAAMGIMPIGMALAGVLTARIGIVAMFILMGVGMGVVAVLGFIDGPFRNAIMPIPEPTEVLLDAAAE